MPLIFKVGVRHEIKMFVEWLSELRLVVVHLKFVAYRPGFDITYAFLNVVDGSTDF